MFERYTEKARRMIFFARYEASQFGSPYIETEHLLLGLLREDKALASRFLLSAEKLETIRDSVERRSKPGPKIATSVDLPLSHESKRVLSYAAEESERLKHQYIDTSHLLLGLLREEKSFAAQLLREQGLTLDSLRELARQSEAAPGHGESASFAILDRQLAAREARGGIWIARQQRIGIRTTQFAIYSADPPRRDENAGAKTPSEKLEQIQTRIRLILERIERAIAQHEFEKARFHSDEERKERENLRLLREEYNLEDSPPQVPLLCINIIGDDSLSEVQARCDDFLAEGVAEIWLLDAQDRRAYTVTKTNGLREFRGEVLRIENPSLELNPGEIL